MITIKPRQVCVSPQNPAVLFMYNYGSCMGVSFSIKTHNMETFRRVDIRNNSSENYKSFLDALDLLIVYANINFLSWYGKHDYSGPVS